MIDGKKISAEMGTGKKEIEIEDVVSIEIIEIPENLIKEKGLATMIDAVPLV
jgi:hypothetical protein